MSGAGLFWLKFGQLTADSGFCRANPKEWDAHQAFRWWTRWTVARQMLWIGLWTRPLLLRLGGPGVCRVQLHLAEGVMKGI